MGEKFHITYWKRCTQSMYNQHLDAISLCQFVLFAVVPVCLINLLVVFHSSYHFGLVYSIYSSCVFIKCSMCLFIHSASHSYSNAWEKKQQQQHIRECVRESLFYTHTTVKFNDSSRLSSCIQFFFFLFRITLEFFAPDHRIIDIIKFEMIALALT